MQSKIFLSSCLALSLALTSFPAFSVGTGDKAPSWQGIDLITNQPINFPAVLNNKPAVLVFWATWCPYCKAFMPYAKQLEAEYGELGVQIITFNAKERGRGDAQAYAKSLRFPMLAIAEADAIAEDYGINFIPGLLVVDGEGMVVYRRKSTNLPAGQTVSQQWANEVRAILGGLMSVETKAKG